jgi:probable HAF family extracellular repeat protein
MTQQISSTAIVSFTMAALVVLQPTFAPLASGANPKPFVIQTLPGLPGSTFSEAWGINNAGRIVGASARSGTAPHAVRWDGDSITDLGTLGGDSSLALDINDRGDVVGYADVGGGILHAALWAHGTVTDLGTLGGSNSAAAAINNRGQVVGWSDVNTAGF